MPVLLPPMLIAQAQVNMGCNGTLLQARGRAELYYTHFAPMALFKGWVIMPGRW